jgi:hypothetical protein
MITLDILPAPVVIVPKDVFVLTCEAMFGDADGYKTVNIGTFENNESGKADLEDAIRTCERMKAKYPYGSGWETNYDDVEGFSKWFMDGDNWPNDPFTDGEIIASYDSYSVTYFDKDGIEHPVKVTL